MTLALLLDNAARRWGARPAISVGMHCLWDYATLAGRVARLATGITAQFGLKPGARVLLAMHNNADYLPLMFACWRAGLVVVPANARLHPAEIGFIAQDADARLALVSPDLAEAVALACPGCPVVVQGSAELDRLAQVDPLPRHPAAPEDTAWIFYTSGTTGRPKGAMLSHRNLLAMAVAYLADVDSLTPRDALLHLAATSHASGLFALSFIAKAGNNILPEAGGYDADEMAALLRREESLTFFAPSILLRRMAQNEAVRESPLDGLRTILTGAGPVYAEDLRLFLDAFGPRLWNGYGQGESPCNITAIDKRTLWDIHHNGPAERLTSVGWARTGTEVRVAEAAGREVPAGESGEILVRGETVMSGYLGRPEATAEALKGGWLHTGDMGRMDAQGFLHLLDRKKDMIVSGGMNVYAREVEEVLLSHPQVAEVAVIGIPDAEWGEVVCAVIVPAGATPAPDEMDALCLSRLARFKRPRRYELVADLPKNSAGKVLKTDLRTRLGGEVEAARRG